MIGSKYSLHSRQSGFTLIEVILALVILAAGLTIIIGLQSSAVSQSLRDRNREFALLTGRQILAQVEVEDLDMPTRDETLPLAKLLEDTKGFDKNDTSRAELERAKEYTARIVSQPVKMPGIDVDILRKISLTISWSPSPIDSVEIVYFIPTNPNAGS